MQQIDTNKKLSPETMKALGFTSHLPGGNPSEPFWKSNGGVEVTFFELPTLEEFWKKVRIYLLRKGREQMKAEVNKKIDLINDFLNKEY